MESPSNLDNTKLTFRAAGDIDGPGIVALARRAGFPAVETDLILRLSTILRSTEHRVFVAVSDDGIVRGLLHVHLRLTLEFDAYVELGSLILDPSCRSQGMGHQLVAEAQRWAKLTGCERMVTRLGIARTEAHEFYEKLGFEGKKEQKLFQKSL